MDFGSQEVEKIHHLVKRGSLGDELSVPKPEGKHEISVPKPATEEAEANQKHSLTKRENVFDELSIPRPPGQDEYSIPKSLSGTDEISIPNENGDREISVPKRLYPTRKHHNEPKHESAEEVVTTVATILESKYTVTDSQILSTAQE